MSSRFKVCKKEEMGALSVGKFSHKLHLRIWNADFSMYELLPFSLKYELKNLQSTFPRFHVKRTVFQLGIKHGVSAWRLDFTYASSETPMNNVALEKEANEMTPNSEDTPHQIRAESREAR